MKRMALVFTLIVALGASACGHNRTSSSHPHHVSTGAALVMLGVAGLLVGGIIYAAKQCDSCGEDEMKPVTYPYPPAGEW